MSTSSVRRIKERGGGGGAKITASRSSSAGRSSKTLTPVSEKPVSGGFKGGDCLGRPAGKENPRPTSRVRGATASLQKPTIRAMPRIDKSVVNGSDGSESRAETRPRWSTSTSAPRGRSSSPSDFSRVLSDMRRSSSGSASGDRSVQRKKGHSGLPNETSDKKCEIGVGISKDEDKSTELCGQLDLQSERVENNSAGAVEISDRTEDLISSDSRNINCKSNDDKPSADSSLRMRVSDEKLKSCVEKSVNVVDLRPRETKTSNKIYGAVGAPKGWKGLTEEAESSAVRKYPSKLHEKLAFLEGKVKRIASDIKRTKDMLDMNNPDSSKVILSDIQQKISGIEKAMGCVADDTNEGKMSLSQDAEDGKRVKELECKQKTSDFVNVAKGLNVEQLEARFFPHHKLLRDRSSSGNSISCSMRAAEVKEPTLEEKSICPVDENCIALEFLASLSKEQSDVTLRAGTSGQKIDEIQEMDDDATSVARNSNITLLNGKGNSDFMLEADETLDAFEDQENNPAMMIDEEFEESCIYPLNEIGRKTSTGGWFVSEGESILLAHDDGSCSFYDIVHCEEKAEYKPPLGVSPNMWRDCWLIRAAGVDGCSGRYVVAASAGNSIESGFCSWDFYTRDVRAFHMDNGSNNARAALAPLPDNVMYRRNGLSTVMAPENKQWWYRPCGSLIISAATCQKMARIYDIRDGEQIMRWELQKPVLTMDYSSPVQWRNRGKVVITEAEGLSFWDVSSESPQALLSVSSSGRKISAIHISNTDAELGGGVRQRVNSSDVEGHDGVFCTVDSINVLDFRQPSGIGLKIPKIGINVQSVFSRGDSIYLGCTNLRSALKKQSCSQIQQFSLRKQKPLTTYELPDTNSHSHCAAVAQVWGNLNVVMGVCGSGLSVFDSYKEEVLQPLSLESSNSQSVREVIGPDDLYSPSFDYLGSRALLISRDRPAMWKYMP